MRLRRVSADEQVIDLPRARLVPDPRHSPLDVTRLAEVFATSFPDHQARVEAVMMDFHRNGGALGRMLIDDGGVDERTLAYTMARQLQMPLADLRVDRPDPAATAWVQPLDAHRYAVLPLRYDGSVLTVAVIDPLDFDMVYFLESLPVVQVNLQVAPAAEVRSAINQTYPALAEVGQHLREFAKAEVASGPAVEVITHDFGTDEAPVIQVVNKIVTQALRDRASDVHIEPTDGRVRVRYRVDGALKEVLSLPVAMGPALASRIKIMADLNIVERRRPQDGQFQMQIDGHDLDVRVSTTSTIWGEKTVLRLLDKRRSLYHLADLGMPPETHELYSRIVASPSCPTISWRSTSST